MNVPETGDDLCSSKLSFRTTLCFFNAFCWTPSESRFLEVVNADVLAFVEHETIDMFLSSDGGADDGIRFGKWKIKLGHRKSNADGLLSPEDNGVVLSVCDNDVFVKAKGTSCGN